MPDPFLKMTGISQGVSRHQGAGRHQPFRQPGRGDRPRRRERRRQIDADEDPRRRGRAERRRDRARRRRAWTRLTVGGSMRGGIAFVHQELNLFDNLTAAANIFIGREPLKGGPLQADRRARAQRGGPSRCLKQLGADFRPDTPVAALSLAQMQLVEIAKALSLKARLVIMDEPTSSLTATETERLLEHHRAAEGRGRQRHLHLAPAGRGRALRRPRRRAARRQAGRRTRHGRDRCRDDDPPHDRARPEDALPPAGRAARRARSSSWSACGPAYRPEQAVSLSVRRGEILGLAGLVGSGRTELARTIFGLDALQGGEIRIDGEAARDRLAARRDRARASTWCRRTASAPA